MTLALVRSGRNDLATKSKIRLANSGGFAESNRDDASCAIADASCAITDASCAITDAGGLRWESQWGRFPDFGIPFVECQ